MTILPQGLSEAQATAYRLLPRRLLDSAATITLPADADRYFDVTQIWLRRRLTNGERAKLASLCGGECDFRSSTDWQCWWMRVHDRRWRYRVQLRQPTEAAFRYLIEITTGLPVLINYVEFANDWCGLDDARQWARVFDVHMVRLFRRVHNEVRAYSRGARYDAGRKAINKTVFYPEPYSRVTGEVNCLHLEWRVRSAGAVRKHGIATLEDLIAFDHDAFWRKRFDTYLRFYQVDVERLGRLFRNRAEHTRDEHPLVEVKQYGRFTYRFHSDARFGHALMISHKWRAGGKLRRGFKRAQDFVATFGLSSMKPALVPVTVRFGGESEGALSAHFTGLGRLNFVNVDTTVGPRGC